MEEPYLSICESVLKMDSGIRTVAITDDAGTPLAYHVKRGIMTHVGKEEGQRYILNSVIATRNRLMLERGIGKLAYESAVYKKATTVTIPLEFNKERLLFLCASIERHADYKAIVEDKIISFIFEHRIDLI
jgi:fructoselysine-6-P-deglycase FrlB-like protein